MDNLLTDPLGREAKKDETAVRVDFQYGAATFYLKNQSGTVL